MGTPGRASPNRPRPTPSASASANRIGPLAPASAHRPIPSGAQCVPLLPTPSQGPLQRFRRRLRPPRNPEEWPPRARDPHPRRRPLQRHPLTPRRASLALTVSLGPAPGPRHRGPSTLHRICPPTSEWGVTGGASGKPIRRQRRRGGPPQPCQQHCRRRFPTPFCARQGSWIGPQRRLPCPHGRRPPVLIFPHPLPHPEWGFVLLRGPNGRPRETLCYRAAMLGVSRLPFPCALILLTHPLLTPSSHLSQWRG